jgi:hypothetical protein
MEEQVGSFEVAGPGHRRGLAGSRGRSDRAKERPRDDERPGWELSVLLSGGVDPTLSVFVHFYRRSRLA